MAYLPCVRQVDTYRIQPLEIHIAVQFYRTYKPARRLDDTVWTATQSRVCLAKGNLHLPAGATVVALWRRTTSRFVGHACCNRWYRGLKAVGGAIRETYVHYHIMGSGPSSLNLCVFFRLFWDGPVPRWEHHSGSSDPTAAPSNSNSD